MGKLGSNELIRKGIHLASSAIPLIYLLFLRRGLMVFGLVLITTGFTTVEYLRLRYPQVQQWFLRFFGGAIRNIETENVTGATYVFLGALLTTFLFPKMIAVASLLVLSIADSAAALVGIPWGKRAFLDKTLEGSLAFFVTAFLILICFPDIQWWMAALAAGAGTIVEAKRWPINDNVMIPLVVGGLLSLAQLA